MTLTWIIGYRVKEHRFGDFQRYLASAKFKSLRAALEAETGIRIRSTYFSVEPSSTEPGDYPAWDIWDLPNYAAIDRYVKSKARKRFLREYIAPFVDSGYKWITAERAPYLE